MRDTRYFGIVKHRLTWTICASPTFKAPITICDLIKKQAKMEMERNIHPTWKRNTWSLAKGRYQPAKSELKNAPETDRRSTEHPPTSMLTCVYDIVVVCTESRPTRLCGISYVDNLSDRQLDKPDWKTSMRRNGADMITLVYLMVLIGIWYWPTPSMTQVTDDVTVRKKSHHWSATRKAKWSHMPRVLE